MFTIIYEKETGNVYSITSESNADNLRKAINDSQDFIFVDELPQYNFFRQRLTVSDNKLKIINLVLTEQQEKEIIKQESIIELNTLKQWFDETYRYKVEKFTRLIALGKNDDDGKDCNIKKLELYNEAEEKRKRIQELENIINT